MKISKKWIAVALTAIIFTLFVSCNILELPLSKTGSIIFYLATNNLTRTIAPDISLDVATYDIAGSSATGSSFSETGITDTTYTKSKVAIGTWTITATARNSNGDAIAVDSKTINVTAGSQTSISFKCIQISGNGFLSLSLTWPTGLINNPGITAALTSDTDNTVTPLNFTISDGSAIFPSTNFMNGYYTISMKLYDQDSNSLVWAWNETVLIINGQLTKGVWNLIESDMTITQAGSITFQLTTDTKKPIVVNLAGSQTNLLLGETMDLSASGDPIPTSWQWYLDGDPIPGATTSTLTYGSDLPGGSHALVVIARTEDQSGSAGFRFRVSSSSSIYTTGSAWNSYAWFQSNPYGVVSDSISKGSSFSSAWNVADLGTSFPYMLTGDVIGDSKLETLISEDGVVSVFSSSGQLLSSFNLPSSDDAIFLLADIDSDSKAEIFVGKGSGSTTIYAYKPNGSLVKSFQGPTPGDSRIYPMSVINGKLYTRVSTGYSGQPRGVIRFDVATASQEWFFSIGPGGPLGDVVFDYNKDGNPEIAVANSTVHNGYTGDGLNGAGPVTDDGNTWVIVLNSDGTPKLVEKPDNLEIDGPILSFFYDYQNDGSMQLLACNMHPVSYYNGTDQMRIIDIDTGNTLKTVDVGINQWYWVPIFNGNQIYVVLPSSDAVLVYDSSLNLLSTQNIVSFSNICFLNDVDGDGLKELGVSDESTLYIINTSTWETKYTIPISGAFLQAIVSDINNDGKNEILIYDGSLHTYNLN